MRPPTILRLTTSFLLLVTPIVLLAGEARAISLEACDVNGVSARCGQVEVLENRAQPEGRKISLRIVVLESSSHDEAEPLLMFPGGPGQAASALAPLAQQLYGGVLAKRDDASAAVRAAPRTTTLLDMPDGSCFTTSEHRGLLEMCRDLGSEVEAGDVLARAHDIDRTGVAPVEYVARRRGLLAARHFPGLVQAGDTIAVVADIVERNIPVGV